MSTRLDHLRNALCGYQSTLIPFVGYGKSSCALYAMEQGTADDVGIYWFVPKIAYIFNISVYEAAQYFFWGFIVVGWFFACVGLLLLAKTWLGKLIAVVGTLFLAFIAVKVGDVYLAYYFAICLLPLSLWCINYAKKGVYPWLIMTGIFAGLINMIRSYASLGLSLALATVLLSKPLFVWKKKIGMIICFLMGSMSIYLYNKHLITKRDLFLQTVLPYYEKPRENHIFWHNVYAGFGFLVNDMNIIYSDNIAKRFAHQGVYYPSFAYEQKVKMAIINMIKTRLHFVLITLFAKFGVLIYYFLVFANVGIFAALLYRKPFYLELSWWLALVFNALFGLITVPKATYLLGFISCAALYGIYSIIWALNHGLMCDIQKYIRATFFS